MKKLVLAYSGGLDTSYCAVHLSKDLGFEVHAVSVNTGGFTQEEINTIKDKALAIGASTYQNIEAKTTYYNKVVKYLIFGNVLKNNTYPLSVSAERIIQAVEIIEYAKSIGAKYIAHGSTGAGNDQVRFDMIFQILAPEIEIITPIRDQKLSRHEEMSFLQSKGISADWTKSKYSIIPYFGSVSMTLAIFPFPKVFITIFPKEGSRSVWFGIFKLANIFCSSGIY